MFGNDPVKELNPKCNFCKFSTVKSSSLLNHYKNIHQMDESQMPPIVKSQHIGQNKIENQKIFTDG